MSETSFMTPERIGPIEVGRVLMMNPLHLSNAMKKAVSGVNPLGGDSPHYFVCVALMDDKTGVWMPLSSKAKPASPAFFQPMIGQFVQAKQGEIPQKQKIGFSHFYYGNSYYDTGQVWIISNADAYNAAAVDECNRREAKCWNHVKPEFLSTLDQ